MAAWYTYNRIDNYGAPDPYGGFAKPDSNILVPEGTPITAPLAGVVTGINAPDGSLPAWGAVVTIKLTVPYNSVATHIAFLHLSALASGLSVGSSVSAGQVIGVAGSGPNAAGSQKAALGFAFYNGDYYGYGPSWAQYDGSSQLNPVAFLNGLAKSGTPPPPTSGTKTPPGAPITQTITAHLAPSADVTALLILLDSIMLVNNPFTVQNTQVIGGTTIEDPIAWIAEFGTNLWNDTLAVGLRSVFVVIGGYVILKVMNEFIDYSALVDRFSSVVAAV